MKKLIAGLVLAIASAVSFAQTLPSPSYKTITLQTPLAVMSGGTGAATATAAVTALGLNGSMGATQIGFQQSGTSSVLSTVQAMLGYVVRPEQFGAKGDNSTDDTAALQAAINYVHTTFGSFGGTILLRPGSVYMFSSLTSYASVRWQGAGQRVSGLKCTATTGTCMALLDGNEFDGIQFTGSAMTAGGSFFTVPSGATVVLTNDWVQDYANFLTSAGTVQAYNLTAFNGGFNSGNIASADTVFTITAGRLLLENFRSNVSAAYGGKLPHPAISITGGQEIKIAGSSNIQNMGNGININVASGTLVDVEFDGLVASANAGDAINVTSASGANIRTLALIGGNLDTNGGNGLNMSSHAGTATTVIIQGTRINGSALYGANFAGTITNLDVRGSFDSNTLGAINNTATVTNKTITGNGVGAAATMLPVLSGASSSIGGSALTAGQCAGTTVGVTGATTSMSVVVSPVTYPGDGAFWNGYVSSSNTVTVKVCASAALTPTASTYNVRVIQ